MKCRTFLIVIFLAILFSSKDYFLNDSLVLNNKLTKDRISGASDFNLNDIDGDGFIDIIPMDANDEPYTLNGSIFGNGQPYLRNGWNPYNKKTFYYKNISNTSYKRIDIGLFPNYKLIDSTNYFNYTNTEYYNSLIKDNSSIIPPGDSLITNSLYIMNDIIPVDFNGDGIDDIFLAGFKDGPASYNGKVFLTEGVLFLSQAGKSHTRTVLPGSTW